MRLLVGVALCWGGCANLLAQDTEQLDDFYADLSEAAALPEELDFAEQLSSPDPQDEVKLDESFWNPPVASHSPVQTVGYNCPGSLSCSGCAADQRNFGGCQPMSCLTGPYFRSGFNFILGDGFFDESNQVGYNFVLGGRQPLGFGMGGRRLFFDTGVSYMSAFGETVRDVRGKRTVIATGVTSFVDDAFRVTLEEVRRTGIHGGLGWYFGSLMDSPSNDPQMRLGLIVGGRFAHMHGADTVQQLVAPPAGSRQVSLAKTTDMTGGIYVDVETVLLRRNSVLGECQWTFDAEFAHDWVDYEGFEQSGLATASILFGFMVSR